MRVSAQTLTPAGLAGHGGAQGLVATEVDDIDVGVEQLREGHQVMDAFGLDDGRPAVVMPFGPGLALGQQLVLQLQDQVRVLAMRGRDDPELPGQPQSPVKLLVGEAERALVGQVDLEAADAAFDDLHQLPLRRLVAARYGHVEGEVAGAVALGFAQPQLEPRHRLLAAVRPQHLDQGRRAAHQRGLAGRLVRILGERAHARQIDVHVRVDEAGKDVLAGGVNDFRAGRRRDVWLDARDGLVGAEDVGHVALSGGDDFAVLDEQRHARFVNPAPPDWTAQKALSEQTPGLARAALCLINAA